MAPISLLLKKSREKPSPSKLNAKALAEAREAFFRRNKELGHPFSRRPKPGAKEGSPAFREWESRAESLLQYYADVLFPLENEMAEKGVFLSFELVGNAVTFGDIIRQSAICGCETAFVANTKLNARETALGSLLQRRLIAAAFSPGFPPAPQRIFVFADQAEKKILGHFERAEKNPLEFLHTETPLNEKIAGFHIRQAVEGLIDAGFSYPRLPSLLAEMLYQHSLLGEDRDSLLDKFVFDSLMHEAGHMLLRKLIPDRAMPTAVDEFFAYSSSLSASKSTRLYLAELVKQAALYLYSPKGPHTHAAKEFVGEFNRRLGIKEELGPRSLIDSLPRYLCMPVGQVRTISSAILEGVCTELGKSQEGFLEGAAKDAEEAVFG
ncbi:hypothetical protein JW721_02125 [Candidatus Micrarchaeota archaeon]|nr:hypothetical protein [Candidatus Micrarchaeota archaeon]